MSIDSGRSIPLADFVQLQHQDGNVAIVTTADGRPGVIAVGRTASGRQVAWERPDAGSAVEQEVAQRFLSALSTQYGERITSTVAAELHPELDAGVLSTSTIATAVRMAESQRETFGGINFFLELHCSAMARTSAFKDACSRAGIDAGALNDAARLTIDARMRTALSQASQDNWTPLTPAEGERVLDGVLAAWQRDGQQPAGGGV